MNSRTPPLATPTQSAMNRALLDDLKARQITFLRARLVSDAAARQWREHLPAGWAALMATPLEQVVDAAALNRAVDALLAQGSVARAVRPAAKAALAALTRAARVERSRADEWVPRAARPKIDRLLERPNLVPEKLLREVMESDAFEEVMRDRLYEALTEFSEKVNPFFAEWGLPSLLKKLTPFGFAGLGKSLGGVKAEFERRLEPEIRKFLQGFSRQAMRETTDVIIARGDEPKFVAVRKKIAAWLLEQEVGELACQLDEEGAALAQEIGLDVLEHNLGREALATRRRAAVEAFVAAHQDRPIIEILAREGITIAPDFDAIAAATWPLVQSACASAPVQAWLEGMIAEFFDGLPEDPG